MSTHETTSNPVLRFFKRVFRAIRIYLMLIGLIVTLLPFVGAYFAQRMQMEPEPVNFTGNQAALRVELNGALSFTTPDFRERLFVDIFGGQKRVSVSSLRKVFEAAAADQRVKSALVKIGNLSGSMDQFVAVRRLITAFRESGREVTIHLTQADDQSYFLATAANKIVMPRAGSVFLSGPTYQLVYFGEAARKLGIGFEVIRAGKYKSAFEPFIQNEPSAEVIEMYRSIETSSREFILGTVAKARTRAMELVNSWYQRGIYTAQEAMEWGLIDQVENWEAVVQAAETSYGGEGNLLSLSGYESIVERDGLWEGTSGEGGLGLIVAKGEIVMFSDGADEVITPETMQKHLRWAEDTEDVKAVVLRIDSPGGSALASDLIWQDVKRLAAKKPVVVSMGSVAASGGYYIAAPGSHVMAEVSTITGSIGVIGLIPNAAAFEEKYGISFHSITGSNRKALMDLGTPLTEEDREVMGGHIDAAYQLFLERVAEGRKMEVTAVDALGQGRVYNGLQAKELGLIDEVGDLFAAFNKAKELASLDVAKRYPVLTYQKEYKSLADCLRDVADLQRCLTSLDSHIRAALQSEGPITTAKTWLQRFNQDKAWAILPEGVSQSLLQ